MFKKTKLYVGVALVVNALTSFITFIIQQISNPLSQIS